MVKKIHLRLKNTKIPIKIIRNHQKRSKAFSAGDGKSPR